MRTSGPQVFFSLSRSLILGVLSAFAAILVGCGKPAAPAIVRGTVLVNNAPASGVYVVLHNADNQTAGTGRTDKDGAFQLNVSSAGEYPVTCFCPRVTVVMEDYIEGEDLFQGRYRNPQQPAARVAIHAGENTLPPLNLVR